MRKAGSTRRWRAPYRIETKRLHLCAMEPDFLLPVEAGLLRNVGHLLPTMPWIQVEPLSRQARLEVLLEMRGKFDLGLDFIYGIFDAQTSDYIGGTGLHPRVGPDALEIGYWIDCEREGEGLVSEAVVALLFTAFQFMQARRVEVRCAPSNTRSQAIPKRLGFHLDGVMRKGATDVHGELEDRMIWTMLADEYAERHRAQQAVPRLLDARNEPIEEL